MEKHEETRYVKRTKDYSMSFKLQIVQEIEGTTQLQVHKDLWHSK
jgi:hypothetical protein